MKATLRHLFTSITILAALTVATTVPAIASPTDTCESHVVSGTIRWVNKTTWTALNDSGHESTGISSVQVLRDRVRVHYAFTAEKVSSLQATPDESFAAANVRVGASVALDHADIFFYMPSYGSRPVPPSLLSKSNANVWITGIFDERCAA